MIKRIITLLVLFIPLLLEAQNITISGYVEDAKTGEKLIGASIYNPVSMKGTATNYYGFFSLSIPKGTQSLSCSYIGYSQINMQLNLQKDTNLTILLDPNVNIDEVTIVGNRENKVESTRMAVNKIEVNTIKTLPVLFGEVDVLKTVQLLPGVQSGTEGTSGFYVRGGGPDQNLILLDGVPVYNVNHLFGFFSVFNADAIKSVELTKGGFPARYGGRLSSILDIRLKEGNMKEFKGAGSIGLISSKLTLEAPIKKDVSSFIISARRTYIDQVAALFQRMKGKKLDGRYYFYDLNAKVNYKLNSKHRLYLSAYLGRDVGKSKTNREFDADDPSVSEKAYSKDESRLNWGNITTALRWNWAINNKLFSNTTLTYSTYKFGFNFLNEEKNFNQKKAEFSKGEYGYDSGIEDFGIKIDHDFIPSGDHSIKYGVSSTIHKFTPGIFAYKTKDQTTSIDTTYGNKVLQSIESSLYLEDDWRISSRLKVNAGIHFSMFNYKSTTYTSLEPRLSGRFLVNDNFSIKAAYTRMSQYLHLLTNNSVSLPTDLWVPVTEKLKPQHSNQYAASLSFNLPKDFNLNIEGFYKDMDNLIEYKEGASFMDASTDWQDKVTTGKGWSYGAEFLLEKKSGKTTGWIGYTLSWANRQFQDISFGETFPYKYDRRHDISIVITHKFNDKFDIGATWVYGTGRAITLPLETYTKNPFLEQTGNLNIEHIENRNNYREPAYHRLDLGFNFHKKKRWGEATWSIGIYNAYNRKNPFFLYFDNSGDSKKHLTQVSLFPIIPSISYSFKF